MIIIIKKTRTMKATMVTTISLMLFLIATSTKVNAGNTNLPENIDEILKKEISYPDFAKQQKLEGIVLVNFSVNSDGTISVNLTNESNASLRDYVVEKLKKMEILPSKNNINKTYNVKFDFELEK